ncbi:MAG: ABC transporter ATP-binding protein [Actinomycetota bacterium]
MTSRLPSDRPMGTTADPAVVVERVSKSYGDVTAVRAVTLEIGRGEFFTLLGPSGCGKTTTLRMIAGFIMPDEGRILIEGRDVTTVPPNRRPSNMVFQQYALFPHLSVRENVAFGPREARMDRGEIARRVAETLELVQLGALAERRPSQLSGGQQQRVALARALVNRPAVLLLDEPLGALDLKMRKAMQVELKRIQREVGITFVYVTHDQDEALAMSDRIAVMNHGVVEQVGPPQEVYDAPRSLFVAGFIGDANLLTGRLISIAGERATVRVASGAAVDARLVDRVATGAAVVAVVRPESVRLAPPGTRGLEGILVELAFQGAATRAVVETAESVRIVATLPPGGLAPVAVGAPVVAAWDPDRATAFRADEAADLAAASGTEEVVSPGSR